MATLSICTLLKLACIQQHKHKASLRVPCQNCYSNVSQCYVIHTVPIVFVLWTSLALFPIIPALFHKHTPSSRCLFHFHGRSQALPALEGIVLSSVSFHRYYWSRKTVSSYFEAPEIFQLAGAVLTGDSVASLIRWKQIFCDSNYKIAPSAPSPTEQSVIILSIQH